MNWSLVTTPSNEAVYQSCLVNSPCFARASEVHAMRDFASAGAAYNAALQRAKEEILVFAHQDVYLPEGWDECLAESIQKLSKADPNWGVLGVWGITNELKPAGYSYCTGLQKVLGQPFKQPIECTSFDEALLVLRRSSGLRFDEQLPCFHLYGTDIALTAKERSMRSYVISAFCIHNTAGITWLSWKFWRAYFFMRRKWWRRLPVKTPCIVIDRWTLPFIEDRLRGFYSYYIRRRKLGQRVGDPRALHQELISAGQVSPNARTRAASA